MEKLTNEQKALLVAGLASAIDAAGKGQRARWQAECYYMEGVRKTLAVLHYDMPPAWDLCQMSGRSITTL